MIYIPHNINDNIKNTLVVRLNRIIKTTTKTINILNKEIIYFYNKMFQFSKIIYIIKYFIVIDIKNVLSNIQTVLFPASEMIMWRSRSLRLLL